MAETKKEETRGEGDTTMSKTAAASSAAETKKEEPASATPSARPLELEDLQTDLLGTSSMEDSKTSEAPKEEPKTASTSESKSDRVESHRASEMGAAMSEGAKRQLIAFLAGLIIGALLTSFFV
jgi:hypothetical protein